METTLHQQLKDHYSTTHSVQEAWVDGFRIDVKQGRRLIEIQTSSLGAIRDKIRTLLDKHRVTVVKPLIARKFLLLQERPRGKVRGQRWSPKRGAWVDLFDDLAHFATVFPHPNLTMEFPLIEIEEQRFPRKTRRFWHRAYRVVDQRLLEVVGCRTAQTAEDWIRLLDVALPPQFDTQDLSRLADTSRRMAQKVAYCWRKTGSIAIAGKNGNAILYRPATATANRRPVKLRPRIGPFQKKGDPQVA